MKTIGVVSLKGGVGKTSAVVSLGDAFAKFGKKVLLIDGNFSSPNLGIHLNVINPEITLHHVLDRKANIGDAIYKLDNFDILPCSVFSKTQINPLKLRDKINILKKKYDIILIDSSPVLNEETLGVMLASDGLLVITTPDYPTLSTTLKAVKIARQKDIPIIGLVINKIYNKDFELSLEDIENAAEVPVMAMIPHEVNVLKALSEFTPSTTYKPRSKASVEYRKLAGTLIGEKYNPFNLKEFLKRITPSRQAINREIYYTSVFK